MVASWYILYLIFYVYTTENMFGSANVFTDDLTPKTIK